MTTSECPACGRRIEEDDIRTGTNFGSWSEPGYDFEACRFCAPSRDDEDQALSDYQERQVDAYRDER